VSFRTQPRCSFNEQREGAAGFVFQPPPANAIAQQQRPRRETVNFEKPASRPPSAAATG
jgi:hypothetical protein